MQKQLKEYLENEEICGFFLLQSPQIKTTKRDTAYLDCVLTDNSASLPAKLWSIPLEMNTEDVKAASFVYVTGTVEKYQDNLQVKLTFIRPSYEGEKFDKKALIPIVDNPIGLVKEIAETSKGIPDDDIRRLVQKVILDNKSNLAICPAAKSVHHDKVGGLALHICEMLRVTNSLLDIFPFVNRSYLLAAVILHDIGKIDEMSRNDVGMVDDYTTKGKLIGHIVIGINYIGNLGRELNVPEEKILNLQHMILSHHGKAEYGSPVPPKCIEAEFLNYCDLISSRADIYREATKDLDHGEFGTRLYALGFEPYKM